MHRHAFRAMGTSVELLLDGSPNAGSRRALVATEREFQRLEGLLSRFREDSELSALNRRGALYAGPELVELVQAAVLARQETGGRFDATVHDALVAVGYDRSFDEMDSAVATCPPPLRCGGRISVDALTGFVELEPGFRLDLGGIAKGYAADRACTMLSACGPCLVDAGGDIAAWGRAWPVGVDTPDGVVTLELHDCGLATSGVDRRRWTTTDGAAHHLIDPATRKPAVTDLLRVTVVAATARESEVLAKTLFLAGSAGAAYEADARGTPAVLVTADGETILAGGLG